MVKSRLKKSDSENLYFSFVSPKPVMRYSWDLGIYWLIVDADSINCARVGNSVCAFMADHDDTKLCGNVMSVTCDDGVADCHVKRTYSSEMAKTVHSDIDGGFRNGVSPTLHNIVSEVVSKDENGVYTLKTTYSELGEISSVLMPANDEVGFAQLSFDSGDDYMLNSDIRLTRESERNIRLAIERYESEQSSVTDDTQGTESSLEGIDKGGSMPDKPNDDGGANGSDTQQFNIQSSDTAIAEFRTEMAAMKEENLALKTQLGSVESASRVWTAAAKYGQFDLAIKHLEEGGTPEQFADKLLSLNFNSLPSVGGDNDGSLNHQFGGLEKFSFGKLATRSMGEALGHNFVGYKTAKELEQATNFEMEFADKFQVHDRAQTPGAVRFPFESLMSPNWKSEHFAINTTGVAGAIAEDVMYGLSQQALVSMAPVLDVMTVIPGLTANYKIPYGLVGPTVGFNAEGVMQAVSTPTIGKDELSPHAVSVRIELSRESMFQTEGWADTFFRAQIARFIASAIRKATMVGTGTNPQPLGVYETTGITALTDIAKDSDNNATLSRKEYIELVKSITDANADLVAGEAFIMSKGAFYRGVDLQTVAGASYPDWLISDMKNPSVFGVRVIRDNNFEKTGVIDPMMYGNFNSVLVGFFNGMEMIVDIYTRKPLVEISLIAWMDVAVIQPKNLAKVKFVAGTAAF